MKDNVQYIMVVVESAIGSNGYNLFLAFYFDLHTMYVHAHEARARSMFKYLRLSYLILGTIFPFVFIFLITDYCLGHGIHRCIVCIKTHEFLLPYNFFLILYTLPCLYQTETAEIRIKKVFAAITTIRLEEVRRRKKAL